MSKSPICTVAGCSMESSEAIERVQKILEEWGTDYPKENMKKDKEWLYSLLSKYVQIYYIWVVKRKPKEGILVKKKTYFDVYIVKRFSAHLGAIIPMIYLVPLQKG